MKHIPLALLSLAMVTTAFAKIPVSPPKDASYTLKGIVDDDATEPFACSLGTYTVKVKNKDAKQIEATIEGPGMLINSGWLHTSVYSGPQITYRFPENAKIQDGSMLSMYCNGLGERGKPADVTYFVPHRPKKN